MTEGQLFPNLEGFDATWVTALVQCGACFWMNWRPDQLCGIVQDTAYALFDIDESFRDDTARCSGRTYCVPCAAGDFFTRPYAGRVPWSSCTGTAA